MKALIALMFFAGCSIRGPHSGLVRDGALLCADGEEFRLILTEQAQEVENLSGCRVQLSGPRLGRLLIVKDWRVIVADDGSEPFVGVLEQPAMMMVIHDVNFGVPLYLSPESAKILTPYVGRQVMLSGYVIGAHELTVVEFRVLD